MRAYERLEFAKIQKSTRKCKIQAEIKRKPPEINPNPTEIKPKPKKSQPNQSQTSQAQPSHTTERSSTSPAQGTCAAAAALAKQRGPVGTRGKTRCRRTMTSQENLENSKEVGSSLATRVGFRLRAIEHLHQDDWGEAYGTS